MLTAIQHIAQEYKQALQELYGPQLDKLILFGSHARGDFHEESDIDFAVVLADPSMKASNEIIKSSAISFKIGLKHNVCISPILVSSQTLQTSMQGVYRDIRKEGVEI